jgi:hypothetical protein
VNTNAVAAPVAMTATPAASMVISITWLKTISRPAVPGQIGVSPY